MDNAALLHRAAIIDIVVAYATALDTRTWAVETLFTADAIWEYPCRVEALHDPQAVVEMMKTNLLWLDATQHLLANHHVSVHGDAAEHICYYQAAHLRHRTPSGELYLGTGSYHDQLRRTPDGWRFTRRTPSSIWSFGNPAALAHRGPDLTSGL